MCLSGPRPGPGDRGRDDNERVIILSFLGSVGEYRPGLRDEPKSLIGVSKAVPFRIKKESESTITSGDEVEVVSEAFELKDGITVIDSIRDR